MRAIRRWFRRTGIGLGILVFIMLNFLALAPEGRAIVSSFFFVTQVLPIPLKPQEWVTADPVRESVTFPLGDGLSEADIYRIPDNKERAGVLIFLGVNPAPRNDSRVVNLGNGLARAGFVVMMPWSPSMLEKRVQATEPDNLVWAFNYLRGLDYVDKERVGMGGFCVGASISLVAASDSRINEHVDFVSSFGAYYDMQDLLEQIATKRSFYFDVAEPWDPRSLTQEVFTNQLIEGLVDEAEKELLTRIFIEKVLSDSREIPDLSQEGAAVYQLLSSLNAREEADRLTLEEAGALIQELPTTLLEELERISPSNYVDNLKARLLIAHDREDDAVPSEESKRLADALQDRLELHHTEFSFFSHVTPDKTVGPITFVKEAFKLFQYTYKIIRLAS